MDGSVRVGALSLKPEDLLHLDDVALHAGDLGNADDLATPIAEALELHENLNRRSDLLAHAARRQIQASHAYHLLQAAQCITGGVGVDRAHRSVVARVSWPAACRTPLQRAPRRG